jgi:hypothetical protein
MRHRPILGLCLLICAATGAFAGTAQAKGLFVNGDSLAVGTRPFFPSYIPHWNIRTSATISRHAFEGPSILRAASRLPRHIAMSLGTNDDPRNVGSFRSSVRATMAVAGSSRCVVWATIRRPPVAGATYGGYNRVLKSEAKRRRNMKVVHWNAMVLRHPEWVGPDGVHTDAAGYSARARAYVRKLRRCP